MEANREAWDHAHKTFATTLETIDGQANRIQTEQFFRVCDAVGGMFQAMFMGMIASQLKGDIDNSVNSVRQAFLKQPDKCHTLEDLVAYDLESRGLETIRADRASGTVGLIWAKRSVQFVVMYLELLGKQPDITAGECTQNTYEKVLMPYHGWLTSKFVVTVMGLAPDREDVYTKLGLDTEPLAAINSFVAVANPVIGEIQRLLDEHDCDFPDKV